jgi:hypothetical protein
MKRAVLVAVALLGAACQVKSEKELGDRISIQGVVTDAATGKLIPDCG